MFRSRNVVFASLVIALAAPAFAQQPAANSAAEARADKLSPAKAADFLDNVSLNWPLQQPNGAWSWLKCGWPPYEHDDYFGAVFAAIGVGHAPDGYAQAPQAQPGLAKLRRYLKDNPPPDLHHQTMLLWASTKLDGLM